MESHSQLPRSTPEAEGIPSAAVSDFVQALEQHADHPLDAMQGFMLLRHGNVAAAGWWAPYGPQARHELFSLSKSFTSSAIGLAVSEGLLTVDDPVLSFFPDDAPDTPSENLKAMRVRHLLSMNTGHHDDPSQQVFQNYHRLSLLGLESRGQDCTDDNWPRVFLSLPVEHEPGSWFAYNTAATYMLSAIITKVTGELLLDYLRPRLLDPLGIENPLWDTDPRGLNVGGTGLRARTEDIARLGQLYLQKGMWQGQRILPEAWIVEATQATSDNSNTQTNPDWTVGYGYQFWRCRHNCYRGDGAFGQYCVVMPDQDVVLAMNGGVQDMQVILDKVWEHLLPAMQTDALPPNPSAHAALNDKLTSLSLPLPQGQATTPQAAQRSGTTYALEDNEFRLENITLEVGDGSSTLTLRNEQADHSIQVGHAAWLHGSTGLRGYGDEPIAASGAWTSDDTYEVHLCYTERVYCPVFRLHYTSADTLQLAVVPNVSWQPTAIKGIGGQMAG